MTVSIIGGGLAGCEAALQLARAGIRCDLYEMRPVRMTPAHKTGRLAELVCSNSLKSESVDSAPWLLKEELRRLGCALLGAAAKARVPGGNALTVDREVFAREIEDGIATNPLIRLVRDEMREVPPGDAVLSFVFQAGYGEYAVGNADRTFPIPSGMDFPEAAALPVVYHTSYFALHRRAQLQPGEWLLVHAGASGVGMSAIQLGKAIGARVIATAGSEEKLRFCREQGADAAINYREDSWVDRVKEITSGSGAKVIYDPVGGDIFDLSTKCIAPEGRLLVIGFASGRIPSIQANRLLLKNIAVVGAVWGGYVQGHPEYIAETHSALSGLYEEGKIFPQVAMRYRLSQAPEALADLSARKICGKAVLLA